MECEGCGITPEDLPLEREDAEAFFVHAEGNYYCVGCDDIREQASHRLQLLEESYLDFGDGNGYDYDDEDDSWQY